MQTRRTPTVAQVITEEIQRSQQALVAVLQPGSITNTPGGTVPFTGLGTQLLSDAVPSSVAQAWHTAQETIAHQVNLELNESFTQALAVFIESQCMAPETARNTAVLVILQQIRDVVVRIIASYPAEVHQSVDRVMAEIERKLQSSGSQSGRTPSASSTSVTSEVNESIQHAPTCYFSNRIRDLLTWQDS